MGAVHILPQLHGVGKLVVAEGRTVDDVATIVLDGAPAWPVGEVVFSFQGAAQVGVLDARGVTVRSIFISITGCSVVVNTYSFDTLRLIRCSLSSVFSISIMKMIYI